MPDLRSVLAFPAMYRLFGRLIGSGIAEEIVKRVQCPIGVGNTGKEPRMVAVSMAAGLLLEGQRLEHAAGTRHGQDARATARGV